MLEGKCKEDFNKWFETDEKAYKYIFHYHDFPIDIDDVWDKLPDSMQSGVYLEFLDSVGVEVSINNYYRAESLNTWSFEIRSNEGKEYYNSNSASNTRQEALTEAITKANEIYNG